jgi:hypothetical protein
MSSSNQIDSIIQDAFEDVALLIGGAASLHQLDDQLIRILIRRLEHVRSRALTRLAQTDASANRRLKPGKPYHLHPAIEDFLLRKLDDRAPGLAGMRCIEERANHPNEGVDGGANRAASFAQPVESEFSRPSENTTPDAAKGGAR